MTAIDRDALKRIVIFEEGIRLTKYICPAGAVTIGVGHNLDAKPLVPGPHENDAQRIRRLKIPNNVPWTAQEAFDQLDEDIEDAITDLDTRYRWWRDLDQEAMLALADMSFQLGIIRLGAFKRMLIALRNKDYVTAAEECLDSKYARDDSPNRARRRAAQFRSCAVDGEKVDA